MDFIPHLRRPVYMTVAAASIRPDVILQMMTKVAWDIKEVRSQHSQYVEVMLRVRNKDGKILLCRISTYNLCATASPIIFAFRTSSCSACVSRNSGAPSASQPKSGRCSGTSARSARPTSSSRVSPMPRSAATKGGPSCSWTTDSSWSSWRR